MIHDPLEQAEKWMLEGREVAIATVVETWGSSPCPVGYCLIVDDNGNFCGSVSGGCVETEVIAECDSVLLDGHPKLLSFGIADETAWRAGLTCGGQIKIYLERVGFFLNVYIPPVRIFVIGAVHIAQSFIPIANAAGYDVTIIDPRAAFATGERFPDTRLHIEWPDVVFEKHPLDEYCAIVAITHDPKIDDKALQAGLNANCKYIGALGSRKSHARRIERLVTMGIAPEQTKRIAGPIGLDIGASNAGEIAVSIMAQIIETFRKVEK
ncbi:hypothetical protein GQR58_018003 [Nymphon striatum]|nr:hypothetical protein GQR58_018003 [Nymphon striatum]